MSEQQITPERLRMILVVISAGFDAVTSVPCPQCEASAGQGCPPNEYGNPDIHVARVRAWEDRS
jgi:hypothetical protein